MFECSSVIFTIFTSSKITKWRRKGWQEVSVGSILYFRIILTVPGTYVLTISHYFQLSSRDRFWRSSFSNEEIQELM